MPAAEATAAMAREASKSVVFMMSVYVYVCVGVKRGELAKGTYGRGKGKGRERKEWKDDQVGCDKEKKEKKKKEKKKGTRERL